MSDRDRNDRPRRDNRGGGGPRPRRDNRGGPRPRRSRRGRSEYCPEGKCFDYKDV